MRTSRFSRSLVRPNSRSDRGSVLISALIFALILAIVLTGYLRLSTNSLNLAYRTFFADAAANLAETGLEEAVWSFNTMGNSSNATVIANAWNGWTLGNTVADAYMSAAGSGYTSAPTVTLSGGGGSGATATASIGTVYKVIGGVVTPVTGVTAINITNPGSGYATAPAVTLSGGGGSGAAAIARLAATRTITFNNLGQSASGTVKIWVAGYDGSAVVPIVVSKASITPPDGPPIEKTVKIILSKNGALPKGVVSRRGINWNGHPFADSFKSSPTAGVPPFAQYDVNTSRANTIVASLEGPEIDLANGTVRGNVMTGPGVVVTGNGTVTGEQIGNFSYSFAMPPYPTNTGASGYYTLASIPATLPRGGGTPDVPAADGNYYYFVDNKVIGALTISAGKNVVIRGTNTRIEEGLRVLQDSTTVGGVTTYSVGSAKIYIDGPINLSGNDEVNTTSWAGALEIYTTTTQDCTFSGNAVFYGCLFAPNARLVGNGGGNDQSDLCGSFVVGAVTSNGHMCFHYDEGLKNLTNAKPWQLALWTELQSASDRALYAHRFNF